MGFTGLAAPTRREAKGRGVGRGDSSGFGRAKSVIVVFANGGQSQLETWDPKPDAPAEVRGEFGAIATAVPGVCLCEHLPELARLADRYTIVRSVSHDDLDHGSALYLALTGRFHPQKSANPPPSPADFPTLGAVLRRIRPDPDSPYTAVHVNGPALVPELPGPGQDGGFLGRELRPAGRRRRHRSARAPSPTSTPPARAAARAPGRPARRCSTRSTTTGAGGSTTRRCTRWTGSTARPITCSLAPPAARAFDLDAEPALGPRPLRPAPLGPGLPARPPAGRGRRAAHHRHLEPLRPRPGQRPGRHRRLRLGHAQRHLQRLPRPPAAALRPELLGPARRPGPARAARSDARRLHGRVRPRAAGRARSPIRRRHARPQALGRRLFDRRWPAPA